MASTLFGICYNPTWTGWEPGALNNGPDAQLSDADLVNDSFQALWNGGRDGGGNVYRDDLSAIGGAGFNLLRLYNWGPTRGWNGTTGTAHLNFLNYAYSKGVRVVVPVSNYFMSDDTYAWNRQNPTSDYSYGGAPSAIQSALQQFLGSVTDPSTGQLHAAVHSFSVGNEIDIWSLAGQGNSGVVDPASRLARILWWIVNLQGQITAKNLGKALLTSPISNGDQGNPGPGQSGPNPPSYWFGAIVNGVTGGLTPLPMGTNGGPGTFQTSWSGIGGYSWYADWYYNSVNIYQYGPGLAATLGQYDTWRSSSTNSLNWPGQQFTVPLLLTEIGVQRAIPTTAASQTAQAEAVVQTVAKTIQSYVAGASSTRLMGYCLYEFNDEAWLNANWGVFMSGGTLYNEPTGTTQVSYATWPSVNYPVQQLEPVTDSNTGTTLIAQLSAIFRSS